jgi:hypothetical protein
VKIHHHQASGAGWFLFLQGFYILCDWTPRIGGSFTASRGFFPRKKRKTENEERGIHVWGAKFLGSCPVMA